MPIKDPKKCSCCGRGMVTIPAEDLRKKLPVYACKACDVYEQWPRYRRRAA